MAKIELSIKTNFPEAAKDFEKLGQASDAEKERIEKFQNAFKAQNIDKFIDKTNRAAAAVSATRGPMQASVARHKDLQKEIERLIKNGLDPQSDEISKLNREYKRASIELEKHTRKTKRSEKAAERLAAAYEWQGKAVKAIGKIFIGAAAAIGAFGVAAVKAASSIENATASFTPLLGSAEKAEKMVEKLNEAAAKTPFQFSGIAKIAKQILPAMNGSIEDTISTFKMLGDTAGGDIAKLESITRGYMKIMLKGKADMEAINIIAEAGVPIYSELAVSLGVSVDQLFEMSKAGNIAKEDLTNAFKKMTSEGGLFFNGMELSSKTFSGRLSTLKDNLALTAAVLGHKILPKLKPLIDKMILGAKSLRDFVSEGDNLNKTLDIALPILAAATTLMVGFTVAAKGAVAIRAIKTAMLGLNAAMKANLIVLALSLIVAAIVYLSRNWDSFSLNFQESIAKIEASLRVAGAYIQKIWVTAFSSIGIAVTNLYQKIVDKLLFGIEKFLNIAGKLPFVGDKFKDASDAIADVRAALDKGGDAAKNNYAEIIHLANKNINLARAEKEAVLLAIEEKRKARERELAELEKNQAEIDALANIDLETYTAPEIETEQSEIDMFKEKLSALNNLEAVAEAERLAAAEKFLSERMEQEQVAAENRVAWLAKEKNRILSIESLTAQERMAIEEQVEKMQVLSMSEKLSALNNLEAVAEQKRLTTAANFLKARMEQEQITEQERLAWLAAEKNRILSIESLTAQERAAIEQQITALQKEEQQKRIDEAQNEIEQRIDMLSMWANRTFDIFNGINEIAQNISDANIQRYQDEANEKIEALDKELLGEEEYAKQKEQIEKELEKKEKAAARESAETAKAFAITQTTLSMIEAIARAIASAPFPFNLPAIAFATVQGGIQVAAAATVPIPSAETGGTFEIPQIPNTSKADNIGVMASPGETINVIPRGEESGRSLTVNVQIDKEVLWTAVQDGIDSGDLTITNANIRSA